MNTKIKQRLNIAKAILIGTVLAGMVALSAILTFYLSKKWDEPIGKDLPMNESNYEKDKSEDEGKEKVNKTEAEILKELKELEELRMVMLKNPSKESINAYKSAHAKISCFPESCPYELRAGAEGMVMPKEFNRELKDLELMMIMSPTAENIDAYKKKKEKISVKSSCNPDCTQYDIKFGALTFIQGEELVKFLKDMTANIGPYGTMIVVKTICPQCEDLITWLEGVGRDMNQFLIEENRRNNEISNVTAIK